MRLAQVAMHSPEALGLAGIVAGLLLFLTGYVVGAVDVCHSISPCC